MGRGYWVRGRGSWVPSLGSALSMCSNESGAEISSESDKSILLEEIFSFDLTDDLEIPFLCGTEAR